MKLILPLLVCVFLVKISSAQKIHFTDTSNVWNEYVNSYDGSSSGASENYTYQYISDTIINAIKYRQFTVVGYTMPPNFVREDTVLNKVYIWDWNRDTEAVLMDYNLNVGDTFTTAFYYSTNIYKYAVTGIDSTLINSVWHKVWYFTRNLVGAPMSTCTVIEGIGCIQGPLYMISDDGCVECPYEYMYCFSNKGIVPAISPGEQYGYWSGPVFDNSTSCTAIPELRTTALQRSQGDLIISPNPAAVTLNIVSSKAISTITICDVLGHTVFNKECHSDEEQIDVSTFPEGVYIVRINNLETRKFIKQ